MDLLYSLRSAYLQVDASVLSIKERHICKLKMGYFQVEASIFSNRGWHAYTYWQIYLQIEAIVLHRKTCILRIEGNKARNGVL